MTYVTTWRAIFIISLRMIDDEHERPAYKRTRD